MVGFQKGICKFWQHLLLSLDLGRPFEKLPRQPADISGDESGTVMDNFC